MSTRLRSWIVLLAFVACICSGRRACSAMLRHPRVSPR